ncbi:hypothetical protein tb265_39080 [Gemmatimonadetes bacterium T265]|nr:hypothetical protein tb265_39080 [Gemmatimonadetes bacterium T265]
MADQTSRVTLTLSAVDDGATRVVQALEAAATSAAGGIAGAQAAAAAAGEAAAADLGASGAAAQASAAEFETAAAALKALGIAAKVTGDDGAASLRQLVVAARDVASANASLQGFGLAPRAVDADTAKANAAAARAAAQERAAAAQEAAAASAAAGAGAEAAAAGVRALTRAEIEQQEVIRAANAALRDEVRESLGLNNAARAAAAAKAEEVAARRAAAEAARVEAAEKRTADQAATASAREAAAAQATANQEALASERAATEAAGARRAAILETVKQIVILEAAYGALHKAAQFVETGVTFNTTLESASLGITAVLNAQAQLRDGQGRQLEGQEKLNAAEAVADDQIRKLRVDSLQTASTTQQLVENLQAAEGAGLRAGLTVDQIRGLVVRMTQAAGALNVPFSELNVSMVELLSGHVNLRNRLLIELGIRQQDVALAKQQGTLVDYITDKLARYGDIGTRVAGSFKGINSNLTETLHIVSGEATRPLFDGFKAAAQDALHGLFDFTTADVATQVKPLVAGLQEGFKAGGALLGDVFVGAVHGAQDLARWLQENRSEITPLVASGLELARTVGGLAGDVAGVAAATVRWGVETGTVRAILDGVRDVIQFVRDHPITAGLAVAAYEGGIFGAAGAARAVAAVGSILTAVRELTVAELAANAAAAINPYVLAAAGIAALLVYVEKLRGERAAEVQQLTASNTAYGAQTAHLVTLTREYQALQAQIAGGALQGQALASAQQRLRDLTDELVKLDPAYRSALASAGTSHRSLAEAIQAETDARVRNIRTVAASASAALFAAEDARDQLLGKISRNGAALELQTDGTFKVIGKDAASLNAALAPLQDRVVRASQELGALRGAVDAVDRVLAAPKSPPTVTAPTEPPDGRKAAADANKDAAGAVQDAKAKLAELKATEDDLLARSAISIATYVRTVAAGITAAYAAERAALTADRDAQTDAASRRRVQARLDALGSEELKARADLDRKRVDLERAFNDQVAQLDAQAVRGRGDVVGAATLALERQYAELRKKAAAEGRLDVVATIDLRVKEGAGQAAVQQVEALLQRTAQASAREEQTVQAQLAAGTLSHAEARQQLAAAYTRERDAILAELPALTAWAQATGQATDAEKVLAYAAQVDGLNTKIRQSTDEYARLGSKIRESVTNDLATFLGSGIDKVRTLGEAVRGLLLSVAGDIQQAIGRSLAETAVDKVRGLFGAATGAQQGTQLAKSSAELGVGGAVVKEGGDRVTAGAGALAAAGQVVLAAASAITAAAAALAAAGATSAGTSVAGSLVPFASDLAGVPAFADGGRVPGASAHDRADNIPAWLTANEYVHPVAAVRYYGVPVMEALRTQQIPRELFAAIGAGRTAVRSLASASAVPGAAHGAQGYAAGGVVENTVARIATARAQAPPAASGAHTLEGGLTLDLAEGLVARHITAHLSSRDGQRQVLDVLHRNGGTVRAIANRR